MDREVQVADPSMLFRGLGLGIDEGICRLLLKLRS